MFKAIWGFNLNQPLSAECVNRGQPVVWAGYFVLQCTKCTEIEFKNKNHTVCKYLVLSSIKSLLVHLFAKGGGKFLQGYIIHTFKRIDTTFKSRSEAWMTCSAAGERRKTKCEAAAVYCWQGFYLLLASLNTCTPWLYLGKPLRVPEVLDSILYMQSSRILFIL